jgi:ATP-dependent protease ClpP protease subunit
MWDMAAALTWYECAQRGQLIIPRFLHDRAAQAILWQVKFGGARDWHLDVDCESGDNTCWDIAAALGKYPANTHAHVDSRAVSAGLIVTVACQARTCVPHAQFCFHGKDARDARDEERARWFADRTTAGFDFWLEKAATGEEFWFNADEALALGVVQKVVAE